MKKFLKTAVVGLTLAAVLTAPAAAARTVPVTVDSALLSGTAYLREGVTSVPLRPLLDALGGWNIRWDSGSQAAVAERDRYTVIARPGDDTLTVDGAAVPLPCPVFLENGRTYVPLRALCEALGLGVRWDSTLGGAAVDSEDTTACYSDEDLYWLSRIISAESRGESLTGQIAVGNVVLNRVASEAFPDTVQEVVFDRKDGVQFEPVSNGTVYLEPTPLSVTAAKAALAGTAPVGESLYFFAPKLSQGTWIRENRTYFDTIGCHRFYL